MKWYKNMIKEQQNEEENKWRLLLYKNYPKLTLVEKKH